MVCTESDIHHLTLNNSCNRWNTTILRSPSKTSRIHYELSKSSIPDGQPVVVPTSEEEQPRCVCIKDTIWYVKMQCNNCEVCTRMVVCHLKSNMKIHYCTKIQG